MRSRLTRLLLAATLAPAVPLAAQASAAPAIAPNAQTAPVVVDLFADIRQLESKMMGLARAIPADKYDWRPGAGVRSVSEVVMHVAADNYLLPAAVGYPADAATGIKGDDYKTAQAFERRQVSRDSAIAEMARSFAFLKRSMVATQAPRMSEKVTMFGQTFTVQQVWIMTATHLHEHLGQMIAYARSNGIAPPWGQ